MSATSLEDGSLFNNGLEIQQESFQVQAVYNGNLSDIHSCKSQKDFLLTLLPQLWAKKKQCCLISPEQAAEDGAGKHY